MANTQKKYRSGQNSAATPLTRIRMLNFDEHSIWFNMKTWLIEGTIRYEIGIFHQNVRLQESSAAQKVALARLNLS